MTTASNIVVEWLHSLHLGEYSESFIDNGYDDLEICKQISEPDLDAIGVFKQTHRLRLLQSVKRLREEGAASVYFTLEESNSRAKGNNDAAALVSDDDDDDDTLARKKHQMQRNQITTIAQVTAPASGPAPGDKLVTAARTLQHRTKFLDEYEEGKAELVRIPRMQLRLLLQEKLRTDGIRLDCQPYTTPEGERGYLEGLASRYADLLRTHYGDVLEPLEELRRRETNVSPKKSNTQLTTSHSQPFYTPGKYSPSSCLSDKEEDEIYGFGYGVFARQMLQQKQQKLALTTQSFDPNNLTQKQQSNYQSCLSPRSAFFYEFPPNERGRGTSKKKTTFSRILRTLKTHKKDKHGSTNNPAKQRQPTTIPQRVDTPDSVLHSGLGLTPDNNFTVLRSMVDPRDYERLKYLRINGYQNNSFEETIQRLKVSEALKKKERFNKEHEEILRDIRQGLMHFEREDRCQPFRDDTYMYDDEARCGDYRKRDFMGDVQQHWYDEPPYESDPEDFLMSTGNEIPYGHIIENDRVYKLNLSPDKRNEGVISLSTAGDISLPKKGSYRKPGLPTMRGLIVPQGHNNLPTIIPLRHSRTSRESAEYESSEIQSRSSGEDDNEESARSPDTDYEDPSDIHQSDLKKAWYAGQQIKHCQTMGTENNKCIRDMKGGGSAISGGVGGVMSSGISVAVSSIAGRARTLRQDVQRKISRLRQQHAVSNSISDGTLPCSASSVESLPSGSGSSSTQALVRAGSNHSSISCCEERDSLAASPQHHPYTHHTMVHDHPTAVLQSSNPMQQHISGGLIPTTVICRARAIVDCMPSPYDKDALAFKKGDIIDVVQMNASGLWKGVVHNRLGYFKFINVDILNERFTRGAGKHFGKKYKHKPASVPELLQRMNLQEYVSVFLLNGYEDLELFREIEPADLDYLCIRHPEHRAKILTAVQLLHDLQSNSDEEELGRSSSETEEVTADIRYNVSKMDIGKKTGSFENDLSVKPTDNQSTEFQANVPLCMTVPKSTTRISAPVD